jgi:CheY-like chemotaxis protein/anti-sigma regulatory factor (Ser/Thr protein kinase)
MAEQKRILIVEDDRAVKSSLERLFRGCDVQVTTASTGAEALERCRTAPCDFVFADLVLPDMDGIEMIRRLRQHQADLPFAILTAYGDKDDAVRALKMGAVDFLQKPFDVEQMLQIARSRLQTRRSDIPDATMSSRTCGTGSEDLMNDPKQADIQGDSEKTADWMQLLDLYAPFISIGRLSSGITHNLNGFLTGLMGHLEILKMKKPELSADIDNVMVQAKRIRDGIIEISNKYDNETVREAQPQNINQIIRAELSFLRADLFYKHFIQVDLDLEESLPNVFGIYADFAAALEEILLNAVDAQRGRKTGRIGVKTYAADERVLIEVEDDGDGFSPEALQRAFEPFWPDLHIEEDYRIKGGLGLTRARRCLQRWDGRITLENKAQGGAKVTISLPRKYPGNMK